jgi:hypothetical protein
MWEFLGVVFGAFVSIVASFGTVVWVEFLRRPRLYLERAQPTAVDYSPDFPATRVRSLRVRLHNRRLQRWADSWMVRDPALQCRARITFHFLEDENVQFDRTMAGRWTNTPEPTPLFINNPRDGREFAIMPQLVEAVTVYPGENELLDIAVRLNGEVDCYGWDNESYLTGWRNRNWRLGAGRHLVKVEITSSGPRCTGWFRLENAGGRGDFRLEPYLPKTGR